MSKKIIFLRKLIQILFFLLTIYIFISANSIDILYLDLFNALHIFPSFSKLLTVGFSKIFFITFFVLISILFLGRFYCAFLCPFGFIQDIFTIIIKKIFKIKHNFNKNYFSIRSFFLFLAIFSILFKNGILGFIDHISIFGKILNLIILPFFSLFNPIFKKIFGYNLIDGITFSFNLDFYVIVSFLLFLFIISIFKPRFFCNFICPSGTVFALINTFSFLKINLNTNCPNCKQCENICPVTSISKGIIDYKTCISCFECVNICPTKKLNLAFKYDNKLTNNLKDKDNIQLEQLNIKRRELILSFIFTSMSIFLSQKISNFTLRFENIKKIPFPIPPGSQNALNFYSKCSACQLCVTNCPSKVLKPALLEHGIFHIFKPYLDFKKAFCEYNCNVCTKVCPTGAINYLPISEKQVIAIGKVFLDVSSKTECVPYKHKRDCGACAEHCPTGAVYMVKQGDVFVPKIRRAFCNGCGACEYICPIKENKPIKVVPLSKHIKVPKIEEEKPKSLNFTDKSKDTVSNSNDNKAIKKEPANDFPF